MIKVGDIIKIKKILKEGYYPCRAHPEGQIFFNSRMSKFLGRCCVVSRVMYAENGDFLVKVKDDSYGWTFSKAFVQELPRDWA